MVYKPEMQPVRFFLTGPAAGQTQPDRSGPASRPEMSHQKVFSLKLSHNFCWIIAMTSQDSTDEQDTFLTCAHLNTG